MKFLNMDTLPKEYLNLEDMELVDRIHKAKSLIGDQVIILGHHYIKDEVLQFADRFGDSYELAKQAAALKDVPYIIFCGVHFMAETADILSQDNQQVILPDLSAGCFLAQMATLTGVEAAWNTLNSFITDTIIPVTYVNSTAEIKAFTARHGGSVCTSSNADKIIDWAFKQGQRLFFFPDRHLGKNSTYKMGIPLDQMIVWDPDQPLGGNTEEQIEKAKVILWHGFCNVHQSFTVEQIENVRKQYPDVKILVHPECPFEVVQLSDYAGSTGGIIKEVEQAKEGETLAIGTEGNLVNRLKEKNPHLHIISLSPSLNICSTMYRIRLPYLSWVLEELQNNRVIHRIRVEENIAGDAKIALNRMISITEKSN